MSEPGGAATVPLCIVCRAPTAERIGDVPVCVTCQPVVRRRPFPAWLTGAGVVLLFLLGASLFWGARHWEPARDFVLARRAAESADWPRASALLAQVLARAPGSEPALLLAIKADLLSGDPGSAFERIRSFGDRKTKNPLLGDINQILERVDRAMQKAEEGRSLAMAGKDEEALAAFEAAASAYPEFEGFATAKEIARASVAFDRGDYETFTAVVRRLHEAAPQDAQLALMLASGLAAQYAVSGDEALAAAARAELERTVARDDVSSQAEFVAYAERIRHRLATREIVSPAEYERRKAAGEIH